MQEHDVYGKIKPVEAVSGTLGHKKRLEETVVPLVNWFLQNKRALPWREEATPYHVWLSEIMLQQTRVEAVIPYYHRFLAQLPDIGALAAVEEEELMKLWQGLGYYNRARNLKAAAQQVVSQYGGELPADYEKLLKLRGIGSYTAGAIASIAFGIPRPAVDGNVLRVISRILASEEDIAQPKVKKQIEEMLLSVMPAVNPGDFNQALMELGAVVCIPGKSPHCTECPVSGLCLAYQNKKTDTIPVKASKKPRRIEEKTVFLIKWKDGYAIRKRPSSGLLANLYEFPNVEGTLNGKQLAEYLVQAGENSFTAEPLPPSRHIFSHVEWRMSAYYIVLRKKKSETFTFYNKEEIEEKYAIPSAFAAYAELLV
ncbi:MAG: A/G-specific adenine glycosylase [Lachnospiraceae bacterium]|nr:A/G-specific adenine glycosylase [Lachnospiraceae bacterium]